MSYKDEFSSASGWSAADVSVRLNNTAGKALLAHLRENGVDTIIRYYASTARPKTITQEEAKFISKEGFAILPVFQDSSRHISDFSREKGTANAKSAIEFAKRIGQPADRGSTIIFAVDADYSTAEIDGPILDYFRAINAQFDGTFNIGAYGSGALLSKLMSELLISLPWISMSRGFRGTEQFFYSNRWSMRQVPPEARHEATGIGFDRNVVRVPGKDLGAFQVDESGRAILAWDDGVDDTLGGGSSHWVEPDTDSLRFVTTDGLRLRASPNGAVIRDLTIGDRVTDLGPSIEMGWRKVRIGSEQGVVFGKYLRDAARPEVEALLCAAIDEWLRFEKGSANEKAEPYFKYVREMWAAIGAPYDGRSRDANGQDVPWSAAFISWVVRKAGPAYAKFQFAWSHSVFVNNAIKARVTGRTDKPFWAYPIGDKKPELGDIIQRNRSGGNYSFSYAENHSSYPSHSDIVVEVTPDVVRVVGGNVGDSVRLGEGLQEYALSDDGHLKSGQGIIALLKNRAGVG